MSIVKHEALTRRHGRCRIHNIRDDKAAEFMLSFPHRLGAHNFRPVTGPNRRHDLVFEYDYGPYWNKTDYNVRRIIQETLSRIDSAAEFKLEDARYETLGRRKRIFGLPI